MIAVGVVEKKSNGGKLLADTDSVNEGAMVVVEERWLSV